MIRLGTLLGILAGLTEVAVVHRVEDWRGAGTALLWLLLLNAALGASIGATAAVGLRVVSGRTGVDARIAWTALLVLALPLILIGWIVHGRFAGWQKLAAGLLCLAAAAGFLAWARLRRDRDPSAMLPRLAGGIGLLLALGWTAWALVDRADSTPIGPFVVVTAAGAEATSPATPASLPAETDAPGLMVVGIDGGTWNILLPLLDRGELPHLARLIDDGVAGVLEAPARSFSPVVWTTIATGKLPAKHGVSNEVAVRSSDRRVLTLWQMLGAAGRRSLVANVPGTAPAEKIPGALFAGFPIRGESFNNLGYLFTDRDDLDWPLPDTDVADMGPFPLTREGDGGLCLDLEETPADRRMTAVLDLLQRGPDPLHIGPELVRRRYGDLCVERQGDALRLHLPPAAPVDLRAGDWSPWIAIERDGAPVTFRIRVVEAGPGATTLWLTPLFDADPQTRITPPELSSDIDTRFGPYVVEGSGWLLYQVPALAGALAEHQFDIARRRLTAVDHVWRSEPWDALFYIVTLTDRIQHPFWTFLDHSAYEGIPDHDDYPFGELPEDGRRVLAEIVEESYRWSDAALGRLLERAGPETIIAVLSDHGATSGPHLYAPAAGVHHPYGIYVLSGGPFSRSTAPSIDRAAIPYADLRVNGETLQHQDVTPTLLSALGLPLGADFDGGPSSLVLADLERRGVVIDVIPSWDPQTTAPVGHGAEPDEALREQLRSLGYVQ